MRQRRLSQEAIAQAMDVSQGLVSGWCLGKYKPDIYQGKALADLLGVALDYLVDASIPAYDARTIELDREIRRIIAQIGPERAWKRLVESEPRFLPAPPPTDPYGFKGGSG